MAAWNPEANDIFLKAVEIPSREHRQAYLAAACPDDALRGQVHALLEASARAGSFLEAPAPDLVVTADEPLAERPGTVIGPYKLLEQIGEGGFGVVFLAEQQEPLRRKVALKVLKPGMGTRQVVARFEAERQALALMDHPNIAQVHDGGSTASGRPYFVMELVKGVPLTDYCDQNSLPIRERLALFIAVCQAVQHAHHKGIIHRDIKPSNVLVTRHDVTPVVKVIDFGIAKATGQQLTEKTLFMHFAQMMGTPLYMSPEQAGLSDLDVDTRSDIYSLGVLLYELLTGTTPFDKERFKEAGYDEMRRIIREEEPPRPSTRLSTLGQAATTASTRRQSDPKRLSQILRGELDWVVMKCLEKDRSRRYETAAALGQDLERYLRHEPVLACPPSAWYRLRKLAQRNRGAVIAAGAVFCALLLGIVGTTFGLIRAEIRRLEAEDASEQEAEQRRLADAEKKRANEFKDKALDALRATTGADVEQLIGMRKELGPNEQAYLEAILRRWQTFADQEGMDESSRTLRGEGHFRVASLWARLGRKEEARGSYQKALEIYKELAEQFPAVPEHQQQLARTHDNLGIMLVHLGKLDEASNAFDAAQGIEKKLVERFPAVPNYHHELAGTHVNLGNLQVRFGKRDAAHSAYGKALEIRKKLAKDFPAVPEYQQGLALTHVNLGSLLLGQGRWAEAHSE
jgi:serine/threonine protein kinase